jgi:hypothetical protein
MGPTEEVSAKPHITTWCAVTEAPESRISCTPGAVIAAGSRFAQQRLPNLQPLTPQIVIIDKSTPKIVDRDADAAKTSFQEGHFYPVCYFTTCVLALEFQKTRRQIVKCRCESQM